jgi:hypothetical protein
MRNHHRLGLGILVTFSLTLGVGCGPVLVKSPPEQFEPTCIQGKVWYRSSADSNPVPYPYVSVTAWRHGTDQPFGETKSDGTGNYCLELPQGEQVDLRIWGLQQFDGKTYTCKGSEESIKAGTALNRCGDGCVEVDPVADCEETQSPYHRQM